MTVKKGRTTYATTNMSSRFVPTGTYTIKSSEDYVYINGVKVDASSGYSLEVESGVLYQIITQSGTESPYITVLKGN